MSFILIEMDQPSLDRLLQQRRDKASASLPGAFSQNVWREIRMRKSERTESSSPFALWGWLLRPQMVVAAMVLSVGVGIGLGSRSQMSERTQARSALNLEVFGDASPALPSTLLAARL